MIANSLHVSALAVLLMLGACQAPSEPTTAEPASAPLAAADTGSTAALPPPTVAINGRTAIISLPLRLSDNLIWVSSTRMSEADPFVFKGLEIKPGGGPQGTDLAVFFYEADHAGATVLKFGLVPPGKMLVGLPGAIYTGPVAARFETSVTVQ
ncbi:hypothetical protein [Asticcacaulis benevestitus]|uniref:Proteinase inhibitor I42 chagasin domain-containing protein n=1 Tax=Asticcacaulis benevestitus DSM 16100 = ATCC BAA-896 TaxID=1121022 RepID=V4RGJ8_9CAUL|nr:hypothetical protein [Asticcacaulis benevestitus]ESQ90478.1 hypothetical protein ABENE_12205 [Asticcacaulis benevestitus DSM 16100 = ATCC BAA-896]